MKPTESTVSLREIPVLLRGEPERINEWIERWNGGRVLLYVAVIVTGTGLFGAAMGIWWAPLQSVYTAAKFPLVVLLTTLGNALLNGMLAPLLGLNLAFRQSLLLILVSFAIAATILGAFSPLVYFLVWNVTPLSPGNQTSWTDFTLIQLCLVAMIAFAGVAANLRLGQLLQRLSGSTTVARRILLAWLAGNLFLGSQLSWILRPFIGAPHLPVEFLRANAFQGNFYETIFYAARRLFFP